MWIFNRVCECLIPPVVMLVCFAPCVIGLGRERSQSALISILERLLESMIPGLMFDVSMG